MLITNWTWPRASKSCASVLRFHLSNEIEVSAVLHGVEQRSTLRTVIGEQDGRRQMPRIGIDRVTEQRELNQRNAEHHRKGEPVASHLQ